ncbi:hypothetical protein EDD18DRAFT_773168 [Armillaria luteobubalina]|uniref:Uncharacterized protein n=1 Tax=Armillaria luteobubalina TaxID=153913 RepID=A0AA39QEI8_9AGAR|nr:hypothetical protein EDD18DRAFT_773168 [Armillaria luteobubalina]
MFNDGSQQHNDAGTPRVIVSAHIDCPYSRVTKNFDKMVVAIGSLSTLPLTDDPWFHLSDRAVQTTRHSRQDVVGVEASKPALGTIERLVLNGYRVTPVLRNSLYLPPPSANDPNTGAPADAAGPAGAVGTRGSVLNNARMHTLLSFPC